LPQHTWHGILHDLFSLTGFVALAGACFVFGRRFAARGERGWVAYSLALIFWQKDTLQQPRSI
jgi:hypothetical protein